MHKSRYLSGEAVRRTVALLGFTGILAVGVLVSGATGQGGKVRSGDIARNAVKSKHVKNRTLKAGDLKPRLRQRINQPGPAGPEGPEGPPGLSNLESDGPYPGATDLGSLEGQGDNSDDMWANDGSRQTSWVQCAPDKVALGGGFHLAADAGDAPARAVQVVVSEPTQVFEGETVYDNPAAIEPIEGDEAQSIVPNGWIVQGFNDGDNPVIVRPWVVCAEVG